MNEERRREWRLLVDFLRLSRSCGDSVRRNRLEELCDPECQGLKKEEERKRKERNKEESVAPSRSTMPVSISRTGGPRNGGVFNTRGCEVG